MRGEIQGLRAIAVLAIVLFHSGVSVLPGGFLGVDIFFVISGFLITGNIIRDVERGSFSLRTFYVRRILRLLPAAATTIGATLAASFVFFPPDEVVAISWSAVAALTSLSNLYFWSTVGYFDSSAHLKPLLHMWSLAVEEQFYLVWPLALLLLARLRALAVASLTLGVASLAACYAFMLRDPSAAFYLMPFRVFEFVIGILLAIAGRRGEISSPVIGAIVGSIGLVAIAYALTQFSSDMPLPSLMSLVPCAGTAAIISAGRAPLVRGVLGNGLMSFVGRISYSLYLVHWPIVTLLLAASIELHPIGTVGLCFAAASLQYSLIERPFRRGSAINTFRFSTSAAMAGCVGVVIVAGSASAYGVATSGLKFRLPPELRDVPSAHAMWAARNLRVRVRQCFIMDDQTFADFDRSTCLAARTGKKNYLIVGDSFAADLYAALSLAFPKINFMQATSANCTPFVGNTKNANCSALLRFVFDEYLPTAQLTAVVLAGGWSYDIELIEHTLAYLRKAGVPVILFGPPIRFRKNVPTLMYESRALTREAVEKFAYANRHPGDGANVLIKKRFSGEVPFIDLHETMCMPRCELFSNTGKMIFVDFGHLTVDGELYLSERLRVVAQSVF